MPAGYSGTPLVTKLGIKPGHVVSFVGEPSEFRDLLVGLPGDVRVQDLVPGEVDVVVTFHTTLASLEATLGPAADAVFPDGAVWVAWPKQAARVPTDLDGNVVREAILRNARLVDNKVCAISDTWSGLRMVWRREHRR